MKTHLLQQIILVVACTTVIACDNPSYRVEQLVDRYNYVLGTQTIGAKYKFTDAPVLIETASRIRDMGSNIIKIALNPTENDPDMSAWKEASPKILASECPILKSVLDMDFTYIFMWVTTPGVNWVDGMSAEESDREYTAIRELAEYLLTTYKGTHKQFYIGHWEGDWLLLGNYSRTQEKIDNARIDGMTNWYNIRQRAITDARNNINSDVKVYHYLELNRVTPAMLYGYDRIVNRVLPRVNVDYVSYSSYESTSEEVSGADYTELQSYLHRTLNYIDSLLKPNSSIIGRRVFIGEYGYSLPLVANSPEEQARRSVHTIRAALEWGCPFILYWEMYDNEGIDKGFWMINHRNEEQPIYDVHKLFYQHMKEFVRKQILEKGQEPSRDEFQTEALNWLSEY